MTSSLNFCDTLLTWLSPGEDPCMCFTPFGPCQRNLISMWSGNGIRMGGQYNYDIDNDIDDNVDTFNNAKTITQPNQYLQEPIKQIISDTTITQPDRYFQEPVQQIIPDTRSVHFEDMDRIKNAKRHLSAVLENQHIDR